VLSAYRDANPSAEAKLKIFVNPQSNEVKNDRERGEADREPFEQIMTIVNKMEPASVVALVYRILQRTVYWLVSSLIDKEIWLLNFLVCCDHRAKMIFAIKFGEMNFDPSNLYYSFVRLRCVRLTQR
jgi:hypothetical protein